MSLPATKLRMIACDVQKHKYVCTCMHIPWASVWGCVGACGWVRACVREAWQQSCLVLYTIPTREAYQLVFSNHNLLNQLTGTQPHLLRVTKGAHYLPSCRGRRNAAYLLHIPSISQYTPYTAVLIQISQYNSVYFNITIQYIF